MDVALHAEVLTCIPETVKYGISKFTRTGGMRPCCSSSAATDGSPNLLRSMNSFPPGKFLIFQTRASFSGAYIAVPCQKERLCKGSSCSAKLISPELEAQTCDARTVGVIASGGIGRIISTFVAALRSLNCDRVFTRYSVRLLLCFSTLHSTHIKGLTFWLSRYVLHNAQQE